MRGLGLLGFKPFRLGVERVHALELLGFKPFRLGGVSARFGLLGFKPFRLGLEVD